MPPVIGVAEPDDPISPDDARQFDDSVTVLEFCELGPMTPMTPDTPMNLKKHQNANAGVLW